MTTYPTDQDTADVCCVPYTCRVCGRCTHCQTCDPQAHAAPPRPAARVLRRMADQPHDTY